MHNVGLISVFLESLPDGIYDGDSILLQEIQKYMMIALEDLVNFMDEQQITEKWQQFWNVKTKVDV